MKQYVTYLRVSTDRQGESKLGLEAQREACRSYVKDNPILEEYIEVESGKKDNREVLEKAMFYCKKHSAILLVAKLDRLSRSASFIFKMLDSKIQFEAIDLPEFNTLTIGIFASIAQHERERISERTKSALAAKKARGETWGKPLTEEARAKGRAKGHETQRKKQTRVRESVENLVKRGLNIPQIRESLFIAGIKTKNGTPLSFDTVQKYYKK
jgi:DNA invertase Pin-like site-specific DNA recombinase